MEQKYEALISAVVKHQETIIGPLAQNEAGKVSGVSLSEGQVNIAGDGKSTLENLVKQYEKLFGQASVEACKDAVRPLLPEMKGIELPEILS